MLEHMRNAGTTVYLVDTARAIPDHNRGYGSPRIRPHNDFETISQILFHDFGWSSQCFSQKRERKINSQKQIPTERTQAG
jgi:hypothetical protein